MNPRFAAIVLGLVLALGACAMQVRFDIEGEYDVSGVVTESNSPTFSVGDVVNDVFVVTESGGTVSVAITGAVLTGTRNGNTVEATYADVDVEATALLTWTSDTEFSGTLRVDEVGTTEYWIFELTGTLTTTVTSMGTGFLD